MFSVLFFIISIAATLFCAALLIEAWIYWRKIPVFHPFIQSLFNLTNWLTVPIRKVIPPYQRLDLASLVAALLVCFIEVLAFYFLAHLNLFADFWIIPMTSILLLAKNMLNLLFWITLLYALMSWINPGSPAMGLFRALLEPLLMPIRRWPLLNRLNTIDLSPLVVAVLTQVGIMILSQMNPLILSL